MVRRQAISTLFPSRRSSDLAIVDPRGFRPQATEHQGRGWVVASETCALDITGATLVRELEPGDFVRIQDRKSTRLNSSHVAISYAVFCLKKKNPSGRASHST